MAGPGPVAGPIGRLGRSRRGRSPIEGLQVFYVLLASIEADSGHGTGRALMPTQRAAREGRITNFPLWLEESHVPQLEFPWSTPEPEWVAQGHTFEPQVIVVGEVANGNSGRWLEGLINQVGGFIEAHHMIEGLTGTYAICLQFADGETPQWHLHALIAAIRKGPPRSAPLGFDGPRQHRGLLRNRFYLLPDGTYFLHLGPSSPGFRRGQVSVEVGEEVVRTEHRIVREEVLRRSRLVPKGAGPFMTRPERMEHARAMLRGGDRRFLVIPCEQLFPRYYAPGLVIQGETGALPVSCLRGLVEYRHEPVSLNADYAAVNRTTRLWCLEHIPGMSPSKYHRLHRTLRREQGWA